MHGNKNRCSHCPNFFFRIHIAVYCQHWRACHSGKDIEDAIPVVEENKKRDAFSQDAPMELPEDLFSTNPLNLDMGKEDNEECMSNWQKEPVEGFVELFEDDIQN